MSYIESMKDFITKNKWFIFSAIGGVISAYYAFHTDNKNINKKLKPDRQYSNALEIKINNTFIDKLKHHNIPLELLFGKDGVTQEINEDHKDYPKYLIERMNINFSRRIATFIFEDNHENALIDKDEEEKALFGMVAINNLIEKIYNYRQHRIDHRFNGATGHDLVNNSNIVIYKLYFDLIDIIFDAIIKIDNTQNIPLINLLRAHKSDFISGAHMVYYDLKKDLKAKESSIKNYCVDLGEYKQIDDIKKLIENIKSNFRKLRLQADDKQNKLSNIDGEE